MKSKLILMGLIAVSSLMSAQVPTTGLVGSWDFNGNLLDGTSGGNNGTWMTAGSANYVLDRCNNVGKALRFDGIADYVKMKFPGPGGTSARSLSFWMRTDNTTSGDQYVVRGIFNYGLYTTGTTGSRWEICHNYGCQGVGVDISYEYFTTQSSCVNNGRWHHVVVTQAAGAQLNAAKVYIDGILMPAPSVQLVYPGSGMPNCSPTSNVGPNATDVSIPKANKVITIGSVLGSLMPSLPAGTPGRFFDGDLDDFFLYDRVLTSVEVAQLFAEKCEMIPCISCDDASGGYEEGGQGKLSQPEKMNQLTNEGSENKTSNTSVQLSDKNVVVLTQNVPNPFAESTVISYNIPEGFARAQILISTGNGNLIKSVDIKEAGQGSLTIFANDLSKGIYSYALVIDGKTMDTKKMVKE